MARTLPAHAVEAVRRVATLSAMSTTPSDPLTVTAPECPVCRSPLGLGSQGALDSWTCPQGHGLAMTLSEAHGRLQDDEIAELWQLARAARGGGRPSPFAPHAPMARIVVPFDADDAEAGSPGDGPEDGVVELDVDVEQQFIWFDAGESDALPHDLADAPPSAEELSRLAQVRAQFGSDLEAALDRRDDGELTERLYALVAARPRLHRTLDRMGRAVTAY